MALTLGSLFESSVWFGKYASAGGCAVALYNDNLERVAILGGLAVTLDLFQHTIGYVRTYVLKKDIDNLDNARISDNNELARLQMSNKNLRDDVTSLQFDVDRLKSKAPSM